MCGYPASLHIGKCREHGFAFDQRECLLLEATLGWQRKSFSIGNKSLSRYRSLFCGQTDRYLFIDILISQFKQILANSISTDVEKYTRLSQFFIITNKTCYFCLPVSICKTEILPASIFDSVSAQFARNLRNILLFYIGSLNLCCTFNDFIYLKHEKCL